MLTEFPIGTLIFPEPARSEAWHRWRAHIDLDTLPYECQQLLPAVAACLPRWLEGDPSAARIQGIVKRSWSRNQVRLHKAAEVSSLLRDAPIQAALIGPIAWSLQTREEGAIRSIPDISMMIAREHVFAAISALATNGWHLQSPQPNADTLNWSCNLALTKSGETLHLHWNLYPTTTRAHRDAMAFERALLERPRSTEWNGHSFQTLSAEADLLHRLTGRPPWDPVPWQADVLMMSFSHLDWPRFRGLAVRFLALFGTVDVTCRLNDLRRDWQLPIPQLSIPRTPSPPLISDRFTVRKLRRKFDAWRALLWRA
jgi:hypothetical protein